MTLEYTVTAGLPNGWIVNEYDSSRDVLRLVAKFNRREEAELYVSFLRGDPC